MQHTAVLLYDFVSVHTMVSHRNFTPQMCVFVFSPHTRTNAHHALLPPPSANSNPPFFAQENSGSCTMGSSNLRSQRGQIMVGTLWFHTRNSNGVTTLPASPAAQVSDLVVKTTADLCSNMELLRTGQQQQLPAWALFLPLEEFQSDTPK